jgi:integrase
MFSIRWGGGAYLCGMIGCPALTKKELNLALKNLRGRWRWRNRALLILGVRTGLRISELLSLRVGQVHDGEKILPRLYLNRQDSEPGPAPQRRSPLIINGLRRKVGLPG